MPWFRVPVITTTTGHIDVEVDEGQDPIDAALDQGMQPIGICCSGYGREFVRDEGTWEYDTQADGVQRLPDDWNPGE